MVRTEHNKYDTIKDFDELRMALRHIEREHEKKNIKEATTKQSFSKSNNEEG